MLDSDWPSISEYIDLELPGTHLKDIPFNQHWFKTERFDGWSGLVIEKSDQTLAGIMFFVVTPTCFFGRKTQIGWISTTFVSEDERRRGMGAILYLKAYRMFPIIGALAGNAYSDPINDRLGEKLEGVYMRRYIFVHSDRAFELCESNNKSRLVHKMKRPTRASLQVSPVNEVPLDYDRLWQNFRAELSITTNKDRDYLHWRYVEAPYISYTLIELRSDHVLEGFAVVRVQETAVGSVLRIMELIASTKWRNTAFQGLILYAEQMGALFSDFFVIGSSHTQALIQAGFVEPNEDNGLNDLPHLLSPVEHREWSKTFHLGGDLIKGSSSWNFAERIYFTKGDSDRDWPTSYEIKEEPRPISLR